VCVGGSFGDDEEDRKGIQKSNNLICEFCGIVKNDGIGDSKRLASDLSGTNTQYDRTPREVIRAIIKKY
jgi:hypothetical protein